MLDPNFFEIDVFKLGKWEELHKKYDPRFKQDFNMVFEPSGSLASSQDEREDTILF